MLILHLGFLLTLLLVIVFLIRYYKSLMSSDTELYKYWLNKPKLYYGYMKYLVPIIIFGFFILMINSVLIVINLFLKGG